MKHISKMGHPLRIFVLGGFFFFLPAGCRAQPLITVKSPNEKSVFVLKPAGQPAAPEGIGFTIHHQGRDVVLPSVLRLTSQEIDFSGPWSVGKVERSSVDSQWTTRYGELSTVPDRYNQVKVTLESTAARLNLICRAYDEGVAFAYEVPGQRGLKTISLNDECIDYHFAGDYPLWSTPRRKPGVLTAQGMYRRIPISRLEAGCERPLVIEMGEGLIIALAEARLVDYARISYDRAPGGGHVIRSSLDGRVGKVRQDLITGALESERSKSAKVVKALPFQSPWRVVMMADNPGKLLENNYLIQNLNAPNAIADDHWIKPGKVLRETSLTTQGGMAAIDFVASHNMQYVHFDAGWYGNEMDNRSDAATITLDPKRSKGPFDLRAISRYAREKGVGIMLYVNRRALEKQLDELLPLYKSWGIAGIKFGFVRVGDQDATAWLHEAVKKTAAYKMIVDVHDEYRPTGFSRTYPNLLTQEGIMGDETTVSNRHTLITMFTRMLAGAADNTICYYNRRVKRMGSHASQLAKAVCLFSPLQFLYWYDRPAPPSKKPGDLRRDTKHIGNEPELAFFNAVPTTWDETRVLVVDIGEIGVIARRKGREWFVGGINGATARTVEVDLSFLAEGLRHKAKLYTDDPGMKTRTLVKIEEIELDRNGSLKMNLQPDNGFAMWIVPKP